MWSNFPPDPVPVEASAAPNRAPSPPRTARPSRLLPVAQCLAEGGWLAVVAAAIQALFGEFPIVGPLELAVVAGFGMAWARRTRWRGPAGEAFGLPALALLAGTAGWLLSAEVRVALLTGEVAEALTTHPGGWVAAVAFLRGHAHHSRAVDEQVQDGLMHVGLPVVGLAWLIGHLAAARVDPALVQAFTTVAFIGSMLFVGAGVLALGLARLAAVRGDGPGGGSWFGFALAVALAMTVIGIPAAFVLGVPLEALVVALLAPIRIIGALLVLLLSPVVALAALLVDLAREILPEGLRVGSIRLPQIEVGDGQPASSLPGIVFYVVVAIIIALELAAVALYLWWRWRERHAAEALLSEVAEERRVVFERPARPPRTPQPAPLPRYDRADPAGAYLLALEALAADGRWARRPGETPRGHLERMAATGAAAGAAAGEEPSASGPPIAPILARLAAAYQLIRYAGVTLGRAERGRASARLERFERTLRGG